MPPKRINAEGSDSILADLDVPKSFMSPEAPWPYWLLGLFGHIRLENIKMLTSKRSNVRNMADGNIAIFVMVWI